MADISEDLLEDFRERFDLFDKVGDHKVDASQVIDILRACGLNPLTADVEKIVADSELAKDRVDVETFATVYSQIAGAPGQATYEDMLEGLKTMDKDGSNLLSGAELRLVLKNVGDKLSESQADDIVGPHEDAKGLINYPAFIRFLVSGGKKDD